MSSAPSADFSIPVIALVSLTPGPPLSDDVFPLEHDHIAELHKHSKRTDDLPTDVHTLGSQHDIASHEIEEHRDHLETLAAINSVTAEQWSQIGSTLNEIYDNLNTDIQELSKTFEALYPQLHRKIRSKDIPRVDGIIKNLQDNLRGVILKTAHAVDVLDEAEKAVGHSKYHHDILHDRADVLQTKEDHLEKIGDLIHPTRTTMLTVQGAFARTLVNLRTVKEEVDQGVTDPHVIFSDNSVESVVEAWATLRAKAEQRKSHDELYN